MQNDDQSGARSGDHSQYHQGTGSRSHLKFRETPDDVDVSPVCFCAMLHPQTTLKWIDSEIGYGVFATTFIPRGTLVWVRDWLDIILTPQQVRDLPPTMREQVDKYAYIDRHGRHVVLWDFTRYLNHSCEPNLRSVGDSFDVAVRDIHPGEQITTDYAGCNAVELPRCCCGAANCRGEIHPKDDTDRLSEAWDEEVRQAWQLASQVHQPVLPFVRPDEADVPLLHALSGGPDAPLPSIRNCQAWAEVNGN